MSPVDWATIRREYESGTGYKALLRLHPDAGTVEDLRARARAEGWTAAPRAFVTPIPATPAGTPARTCTRDESGGGQGAVARPRGHPRKEVTVEDVLAVGKAFTFRQLAGRLGICENTLMKRRNESPEFAEACDLVIEQGVVRVEDKAAALVEMGDGPTIRFMLATKAGYREKSSVEVSGPDGGPIHVHGEVVTLNIEAKIAKYQKAFETDGREGCVALLQAPEESDEVEP